MFLQINFDVESGPPVFSIPELPSDILERLKKNEVPYVRNAIYLKVYGNEGVWH